MPQTPSDAPDLSGVVPPTVTAFDDSGDLDPGATVAHAQFVVDGGADAVFPLGTNGEFALLTAEERRRVVEAVATDVAAPVIAGVGAPSTRETVAHATHADAAGVDGVVVVTPYYYPLDGEGAVAHYRAVAEAVDVPAYVYHIPSKTGNDLSLATLADIAAIDGVAGLKDSSKDVPWLAQAVDTHPDLQFLVGSDSLLFAGLEIGCTGLVSAVANVFPGLVADLYAAYERGDEAEAQRLQSTVFEVRSALKRGPYMAGVKTALSLRETDFDVGGLRAPLRAMDDDQRAQLRADLTDLNLL
jgi:4-hydroxy-tetrahydrodipicolinate synthase/2-dehydro-3-deoxy-phosphogluconate/2-dehydro-3-deoxy-6-phosphogalactonate aldolase